MASVDEIETAALQWLNKQRGKLTLQRTVYLIPGFEDETGSCFLGGANTIGDIWGPRIFTNWQLARASADVAGNPEKWRWATVRVIDFDDSIVRPSFLDFAKTVRDTIVPQYPNDESGMGEFDVVCHSMGGLDAFAALVDDLVPGDPPLPADQRLARAFNFITMDTPYRGIPNWEARLKMTAASKKAQCTAMRPGSPELRYIDATADKLPARAQRVTCYGVDTASQVEVTSGDLYADRNRWIKERQQCDYRFFQIPGASHSGSQGITQSVITIANLFYTLATGARLSIAA
jgi:pimeloyl-ACP methyl ester carboxylesterase